MEVWELIRNGLQDKEIAEKLYLSTLTIVDHRKALYKKLRVNGNQKIRSKNDASILFMEDWSQFELLNNLNSHDIIEH